jgi:hypothetical protein
MGPGEADDLGTTDLKLWQGSGEGNGLGQPVFGQAPGAGRFQRRMQDPGAGRLCSGIAQTCPLALGEQVVTVLGVACDQSSPS